MMQEYADYWDAHTATVGAVPAVTRWTADEYRDFYRGILGDLRPRRARQIADVGCGPALLIPLLRELWPDARYTGYDISAGMIDYARQTYPDVDFVLIKDELVTTSPPDLIICHSVFTHIWPEHAMMYLSDFADSLAPGGLVSVSIHTDCRDGWRGSVGRIDYQPGYFEDMVMLAGLAISSYKGTAVPAGPVRYYRLVRP